jgi:filamentous hemagglutinin family protein
MRLRVATLLASKLVVTSVLIGSVLLPASRAPAQSGVVRDGTLGPSAAVQPAGPNYVITPGMGEQSGANLFHSFERFSFGNTESAHFQGGAGIANILARVTGGLESDLDGMLSADANLFLMNPAGIVFGENARLDESDRLEFAIYAARHGPAGPGGADSKHGSPIAGPGLSGAFVPSAAG